MGTEKGEERKTGQVVEGKVRMPSCCCGNRHASEVRPGGV